jgi:poly-gamma-glutamate synthesis protein (capsule biosynthesis protein)
MKARRATAALALVAGVLSGCTGSTHQATTPTTTRPAPPATAPATTPSRSRTSAPAATSHSARPRAVTVVGSGDVLIHPPLWQQAHEDAVAEGKKGYDFGPMFASIAPVIREADLATCEMETPLAPPQGPFAGWPRFEAPPQVLTALKSIGYDSCTTASNHTLDDGPSGVRRTLNELDAAGLKHTGSARSAAEAAKPLIVTARNGVRIAQLAYSFGFNGLPVPANKPWLANEIDIPKILAAARRAKRAGADIVVLSMHWGTEYDHLATETQRSQAARLLASPDIDLILGDHAHVVQPVQRLHGKWVIYCMGNQISRHADPVAASREGVLPEFTFTEVSPGAFRVTSVRVVPTWMQLSPKLRLIDLPAAVADPATSAAAKRTYRQIESRIRGYLEAYGAKVTI